MPATPAPPPRLSPDARVTMLAAAVIAAVVVVIGAVWELRGEVLQNRQAGYRNRAVACQSVVVDNERTWPVSDDCRDPAVVAHYPAEMCATVPDLGCG